MNIFRTFWKSVRELFDELFILMIVNVLWLLINALSIIVIVATYTSGSFGLVGLALLFSTISFGPSTAGLYTIAARVTDGRTSSWRDFIAGMRANAKLSWKLYGLWMFGLVVFLFNSQFYSLNGSQLSAFISIVFLYLLVVWFGMLIYIGPLMLLQTDKRIRTIARNTALMTFGRPLFTIVTLVLMAVIIVTSIWLVILLFLVTFSVLALGSVRATLTVVAEAEARRNQAEEKASNAAGPAVKGRGGQVRPRE